ncbi:cytochrome b [Cardiosporidium cionae]|uniref:Cytochrome b n=1 Tax=Cardiosporidium cionae TaxID=476202 RepID=A0ABQ7J4T5_9APIC|nr:cytochrome b [Cardiosporidium cionae]|eukprot:KAF8818755.1 cytochrome b [Cardiosporidium cionae]
MLIRSHLQSYPCPVNLNLMWTFGFLIGMTFVIQILTGLIVAIHYTADISTAAYSVQHLAREFTNGWFYRNMHAIGSSFVFALMYLHMIRSLFYGSSVVSLTWISGIVIYIVTILTSFLGYCLPWGQMSFWAATVICNLLSSDVLITWVTGGFSLSLPTLKRMFVLHFIIPFVTLGIAIVHIFYLHNNGSSNPLGHTPAATLKFPFHPFFFVTDLRGMALLLAVFLFQTLFGYLTSLESPENLCAVDRFQTPLHIFPEWYFLPLYQIIKSLPSKASGCLLIIATLQVLVLFGFGLNRRLNYQSSSLIMSKESVYFMYSFYLLGVFGGITPSASITSGGRIALLSMFLFAHLMDFGKFNQRIRL